MKLNNFSDNFKSTSAVRLLELFFIVLLLVVILYIRLYQLGADPPVGLSISTDVYTDPPQYTLFAKMFCQTGDFNLLNDYRFVFFIKSGVTALAVVVFKLLGVSLWSSNFVGLLYSLGALFLFFLFVRKQFGRLAGIFFLVLISSDFNHIFYGRLPFLEHAMAFYGFLSIVILCYFPNKMGTILAGVSLAVSIFFSKILGVIFLFPFFCYFVYSFQYEGRKNKLKTTGMFAIGFTIVTIFWLFYSYLPMKQRVSSYIQEQTISLYGFPEALESFSTFIFKLVSFGDRTMLFQRMKIPALLGTFLLGMILFHLAKGKPWKHRFGMFNSGHIFITTMIIAFYGSLMIWNYRPLRYQIILIYPFYGAAAVVLKMLWRKWQNTEPEKVPYLFFLFCYPLVLVPLYQFYSYYIESTVGGFFFDDYIYSVAIGAFVLTAIIFVIITLFKKNKIPKKPVLGKILAAIIIGLVFQKGYTDYEFWWARPTFTIRDNSIDLGNILSPEAVLSGPFGSLLTLQNDLPGIIHMFGVSKADPDLFKKYPITHLLQDMSNADRALKDYPEIMDSAVHLLTYHVGLNKVRLFRIAGYTGNPTADRYKLSDFEVLLNQYKDSTIKIDYDLVTKFLKQYPNNLSCYLLLAETAERENYFEMAEIMFKKAVEFSPTNYDLNARLAKLYHDRYKEVKDIKYKELGLKYYELALKFSPTVFKIKMALKELEGM